MKKAFRETFKQVSAIALALGVVVTSAGFNKLPVYAQQEEKKISNPQIEKTTGESGIKPGTVVISGDDDGIIELPFVPYEDLKEN